MTRILGYANSISASPGESIEIKVSCQNIDHYEAQLIRVIHGDINPASGGYREQLINANLGGPFKGRYQAIHAGSYAVVEDVPRLECKTSVGMQVLVWPTLPGRGVQTLLSWMNSSSGIGYHLYLDPNGAIGFEIDGGGKNVVSISTEVPLFAQRWYLISASCDAESGTITVAQTPLKKYFGERDACKLTCTADVKVFPSSLDATIMIAARPGEKQPAWGHFNGRLEAPKILRRPLRDAEMENLLNLQTDDLLAAWNFSEGISTDEIYDQSTNRLHGHLINLPTRGVCGHLWNGDEHCWKKKPQHYGSIHFHDDDLYDCGWETDFVLKLPKNLSSGVYAIRLVGDGDEFFIPFAVRPARGTKTAPVAFIMPSASYMAYANNRIGIDVPETEIVTGRLIQLHPMDMLQQTLPELGLCFYDLHNDGSGVCYSSRLRPIVNMQPKHIGHLGGVGSNVWQFNADTHILDWLEHLDQSFDVITDEDIEAEGLAALSSYKAVITGTHPEYYSIGMLDGLNSYLNSGGRLMYLGGNGFYWRIAYHPTLPGVIECRKSEDGIRAVATPPGEFYSSFSGEYTGLWRRNGRPPNELVGVGMVSQGFDCSSPYVMTEASRSSSRADFIFQGVKGPIIGDYGLSGGGAAGLELDATDHELGTPPHTLVLATSEHHSDLYLMTPEDMNDPAPGLGGTEAPIIRAEMVFFETPRGGAVFSTGSIAWCGSLSHAEYNNDIARITKNVLTRFVDETPFEYDPSAVEN